jgi:hypothetical protein
MPSVTSNCKRGADLDYAVGSFRRNSSDAPVLLDQFGRFCLHFDLKSRVTFALFNHEVQKVPLRHEREKLAVGWKVSEVANCHRFLANLPRQLSHFLMRTLQKFLQDSQFVHQFEGGGVNRVPTEIAQKVGVLFEYGDFEARTSQ